MFSLCLFDLDNTLVRTDQLAEIRPLCKFDTNHVKSPLVVDLLEQVVDPFIYSEQDLQRIRQQFPGMRFGVFTRSPASYAQTVLQWAYPTFGWDVLVAFENVSQHKPNGEGILRAMQATGVTDPSQVILVGDGDADVKAAYHAGCYSALDRTGWLYQRSLENWNALPLCADATFAGVEQLSNILGAPAVQLPELERLSAGAAEPNGLFRFDEINHFTPKDVGGDTRPTHIFVCGRSFTNHGSIAARRRGHGLTAAIEAHKEADAFPAEWVEAIRRFIVQKFISWGPPVSVIVTVVPHRPGRRPRLEALLNQLEQSIAQAPLRNRVVSIAPGLLAYKEGVRSNHNEHLNRHQRFENVRDHLFVQKPELLQSRPNVLVIDDVVTTGASLIYAEKYLQAAGAGVVKCLGIAKSVGDIF